MLPSAERPALHLSDGAIEALKWFALILMTADHINKYLFNATLPVAFEAGRLSLPIFIMVLAYNLSRPHMMQGNRQLHVAGRLVIFGLLASIPFVALGGLRHGWYPLNVLFTLCVITLVVHQLEQHTAHSRRNALLLFLVGGSFVEYWWPGIALGVSTWRYLTRPSRLSASMVLLSSASLWFINGNFWAMAAVPIFLIASHLSVDLPRVRWAFYSYYPLHLAALWLIRIPMRNAGHLFL
ncbi:TraX family protein [Lautropia mirabilis]